MAPLGLNCILAPFSSCPVLTLCPAPKLPSEHSAQPSLLPSGLCWEAPGWWLGSQGCWRLGDIVWVGHGNRSSERSRTVWATLYMAGIQPCLRTSLGPRQCDLLVRLLNLAVIPCLHTLITLAASSRDVGGGPQQDNSNRGTGLCVFLFCLHLRPTETSSHPCHYHSSMVEHHGLKAPKLPA